MAAKSSQQAELVEFAHRVAEKLFDFTGALTKEPATKGFYRKFSTEILLIKNWLSEQDTEAVNESLSEKISIRLRKLEDVCKWKPPSSARSLKSKKRNATQDQDSNNRQGSKNDLVEDLYPELDRLCAPKAKPPQSLRDFAHMATVEEHNKLLGSLRSLPTKNKAAAAKLNIMAVTHRRKETKTINTKGTAKAITIDNSVGGNGDQLQDLFRVLKRYCICERVSENRADLKSNAKEAENDVHMSEKLHIVANISLKSTYIKSGSHLEVSAVFLDHPHDRQPNEQCRWHDSQVKILKSNQQPKKNQAVKFKEPPAALLKGNLESEGDPVDGLEHGLCGLIARRERSRLSLAISNGQLLVSQAHPELSKLKLDKPSVPLTSVLSSEDFSKKMRLVLCCLLAEAVFKFYTSDWMLRGWTKDKVHFMYEDRGDGRHGIFMDQPFLSADFDPKTADTNERYYRAHAFPKILALGIMLLEIELGIKIEDERDDDCYENKELTLNADFMTAEKIFTKRKELWEKRGTFGDVKEAIGVCLIPSRFEKLKDDIEGQRRELKKSVVDPLNEFCQTGFRDLLDISPVEIPIISEDPELNTRSLDLERNPCVGKNPRSALDSVTHAEDGCHYEIERVASVQPSSYVQKFHKTAVRFMNDGARIARLYDEGHHDILASAWKASKATEYMEYIDDFNENFIKPLAKTCNGKQTAEFLQRPVRIAVLDSGVKLKDKNIMGAQEAQYPEARIVEVKSFIGGDADDTYGHGTHVARLFLRAAPRAELYIAKVSETKDIPEHQLAGIAEAIKHAVNDWDVDIISLSLGLDTRHPLIEDALNLTFRGAGKIVFAASSNGGAPKGRAWPACAQGIICINASDGLGNNVGLLSPAIEPNDPNFVTLGLQVPSKEKNKDGKWIDVSLNGTSFATPIAAGMAASILELVRFKLGPKTVAHKEWFYSSRGMKVVLERFSYKVEGYSFLCPWRPPRGENLTLDHLVAELEKAWAEGFC